MPFIEFSERDMKRQVIVEPAWYRVRVDEVNEKTAKNGNSQNYFIEGTILFNGDNGDTKYQGVPTPAGWLFNELAKSFAIGYLSAFGAKVEPGKRFELADSVGRELDVFIENGTWDSRTVNKINHKYRPVKPEVTAKEVV